MFTGIYRDSAGGFSAISAGKTLQYSQIAGGLQGKSVNITRFSLQILQKMKNAMYCHLKSYSCTSSGTRILPEVS